MRSQRARRVAGYGELGLHGQHPDVGLGLVHAAGPSLSDDFHDSLLVNWQSNVFGAAPTWSLKTPAVEHEIGVQTLTTAAGAGAGAVALRATAADFYRVPPPGSAWAVKLRQTVGVTTYELWSGFVSAASRVRTADAVAFVGVRVDRAVDGNLYGVVKSAAGAGNETTIDLGVSPEAAWQIVGFEVEGTVAAPSVQFYRWSLTSRTVKRVAIGAAIATTMPALPLYSCAIGLVTTGAPSREADIDFWSLGGRTARGP